MVIAEITSPQLPTFRVRLSSTAGARSIRRRTGCWRTVALSWAAGVSRGRRAGTGMASSAVYPRAPAGRARGPAEQRRRWAVAARAIGRQRQVCQVTSEHQSNRMEIRKESSLESTTHPIIPLPEFPGMRVA